VAVANLLFALGMAVADFLFDRAAAVADFLFAPEMVVANFPFDRAIASYLEPQEARKFGSANRAVMRMSSSL
jgi:hypothetical protein